MNLHGILVYLTLARACIESPKSKVYRSYLFVDMLQQIEITSIHCINFKESYSIKRIERVPK